MTFIRQLKIKKSISKLTVYDAIKFVSKAWENVKSETIVRSWGKVGILPKDDLDDYVNYEDGEDSIELELQSIINEYYRETQTVENYINHECNYEAEAMPSLEEIVAVLNKEEEEEEEGENIIRISTQDALQSCKDLLIYIQQGEQGFIVEGNMLDSLQELKKKLISQKFKEAKQISLDSYIKID
jgi:hypothetical protein